MLFRLTTIALAVSLTACGGGGGGPGGTSATLNGGGAFGSMSAGTNYTAPRLAGKFDPLVNQNGTASTAAGYAITDIKAKDINADGIDEIIIGGRMSQSFTQQTFQHNAIQLFGWNNNPAALTNETATWFAAGTNVVVGTEPSIRFGNFTGRNDGKLDMFIAGGADDSNIHAPSVLFKNNGNNTFTRIDAPFSGWAHGSAVGDINGDGIDDMVTAVYCGGGCSGTTMIGGANPTFINAGVYGDSVTLGQFKVNGAGDTTNYAIVTQGSPAGTAGQYGMRQWNAVGNNWDGIQMSVTDVSGIVTPQLHTLRIQAINLQTGGPGSDFIVIARPDAGVNGWDASTEKTYVMFYKNTGNGNFQRTAVFIKDASLVYNVEVKDINGDGVNDIMLASQIGNSTVLLGKANGTDIVYAEASASMIQQFEASIAASGQWHNGVSGTNIVKGPNGKSFLVSTVKTYEGANQVMSVYYSEITATGVVTLESSVATLKSIWPQLTDAQAQQILAFSGTRYGDGTILNLANATNPIGQLMLSLRDGTRVALSGHVSGVDLGKYAKMTVADSFNRDYTVDMGVTQTPPTTLWSKFNFNPSTSNTALMSLAGGDVAFNTGLVSDVRLNANGTSDRFAFSGNIYQVSNTSALYVSAVKTQNNPWFNMSGAWGSVVSTTMSEVAGIKQYNDWTVRGGVISAHTEIKRGLVTDVSPMYAVWADTEYKLNDRWSLGGGLLPKLVAGSVTADVPTSMNIDGSVNTTTVSAKINSPTVYYSRFSFTDKIAGLGKHSSYNVSGMFADNGGYMVQLSAKVPF